MRQKKTCSCGKSNSGTGRIVVCLKKDNLNPNAEEIQGAIVVNSPPRASGILAFRTVFFSARQSALIGFAG
jgi:hypothetical protein